MRIKLCFIGSGSLGLRANLRLAAIANSVPGLGRTRSSWAKFGVMLLSCAIGQGTPGAAAAGVHSKTSGTITTFNVPGAGFTVPIAVNRSGTIAGAYFSSSIDHGFLLSAQGTFTTFDAPNGVNGTRPTGLDQAGTVVGTYLDANDMSHGFSRTADGVFTELTGPGGVNLPPSWIGPTGGMAGTYQDIGGLNHGFRISRHGGLVVFEAPGAGSVAGQGTQGLSINRIGELAGFYTDPGGQAHPYLRSETGAITTIVPPGGFVNGFGYEYAPYRLAPLVSINVGGDVAGAFFLPAQNYYGGIVNGFIRSANGTLTTFGIDNNGPCCIFNYVTAINASDSVIGYEDDYYDSNHGYLRTADGTITLFDAPGAGTQYFQGTFPTAINSAGLIVGTYEDSGYGFHGFIRQP